MRGREWHSRFDAESHQRLITMVAAGSVAEIQQQGELWRQTARSLSERSADLTRQLEGFSSSWSGTAATQYKAMVFELADGISEVADVVALTRDLTFSAAECLARAQARMPDLVPIPALSPHASAFAAASDAHAWGSLSEGQQADLTHAWQAMSPDQQQRVAGEIRSYDQAVTDADSARSRAIAVMNELAVQYAVLTEALPELPRLAHAPALPSTDELALEVVNHLNANDWPVAHGSVPADQGMGSEAVGMIDPATGRPIPWSTWTQTPVDAGHELFGDVYAVGSIAASAAVLGIGGLGLRWITSRRDRETAEESHAITPPSWLGGVVPVPGGLDSNPFPGGYGVGSPYPWPTDPPPGIDPGAPEGGGLGTGDSPTPGAGSDKLAGLGGAGLGGAGLGGAGLGGAGLGAAALGGIKGGIPDFGGGIGAGAGDARVASPALSAGASGAGGAEARMLTTLNAGSTASRASMPMNGMMPMMPMTGGAEGAGTGRKAPWLLEREPVFGGESVPVIPPVIGGEDPSDAQRARRRG